MKETENLQVYLQVKRHDISLLILCWYTSIALMLCNKNWSSFLFSPSTAAPKGPKLMITPTRAKVGDTVRITVQGFQVGFPVVSPWGLRNQGQV